MSQGNVEAYGYYTQICSKLKLQYCFDDGDLMVTQYIWPTTTKVGTTMSKDSSRDNCIGWTFLVS